MSFMIKSAKLFAVSSLATLSGILLVTSSSASLEDLPPIVERLPIPEIDTKTQISGIKENIQLQTSVDESHWQSHKLSVKSGDSLGKLLSQIGVSAAEIHELATTSAAKPLVHLKVGDQFSIWLDEQKQIQRVSFPKSQVLTYEVNRKNDQFQVAEIHADVEIQRAVASSEINSAFYIAAQNAGLSPKSIMNLADIFAWDIDFIRELRDGDQLKVIYEKKYIDGEYIGDGDILAAEISTNNQNEMHYAYLMRDGDKNIGYYDENGGSLRKAFLRNPVDVVRITSRFNPKRFHPVLKKWKAHRGVDYGGPTGTPVRATGKGKIIQRAYGPGYGRYIKIQHQNNYMTVYGHFSKFGKYKKGQYVNQGDIIGYIGQSGRATGPHLHYEFRVNNKHVDPLKVKFASAGPIPKKYKSEYQNLVAQLNSQMEQFDNISVAANFE